MKSVDEEIWRIIISCCALGNICSRSASSRFVTRQFRWQTWNITSQNTSQYSKVWSERVIVLNRLVCTRLSLHIYLRYVTNDSSRVDWDDYDPTQILGTWSGPLVTYPQNWWIVELANARCRVEDCERIRWCVVLEHTAGRCVECE